MTKITIRGLYPLTILLLLFFVQTVFAGNHNLSKYEHVDGKGYFDLVVSLSWEPTDAELLMLDDVFKSFAKNLYDMTRRQHFLKTLYVYTGGTFQNSADRFLKKWNGL